MRSERLYLSDVLEAASAVNGFVKSLTRDEFVQNDLVRSAVLHKLTVIGEAMAHLSPEFRMRYPAIEWKDIVGFRNIAVHAYFAADWQIVWVTATSDVPALKGQVETILAAEFPDSAS